VLAGYCAPMLSRGSLVLVVFVLAVSRTAAEPDRKYRPRFGSLKNEQSTM
jgi:hypothetical protein